MYYKSPIPAVFQWRMDISLQEDFRNTIYRDLQSAGYKDATKEDSVYQYYNLKKRQIIPKPREVLYSKEFYCPEDYHLALKEFEEKARKGCDLKPFQSEKIKLSAYNDGILNDWGIQHFHLSRRYRGDGFVARSQYEIFAYVDDDTIYMIQVYPHNVEDLYTKRDMVRILRDNWPQVTEKYHLKDFTELTEKLDDHTYGLVRNEHLFMLLELGKNEIYFPIGGGYSSSGHSLSALRQTDYLLNQLGRFQLVIKDYADWIGKTINQILGIDQQYCNMKIFLLWVDSLNKATMCEENSKLIIQVDTKESLVRVCNSYEVFG